MNPNDATLLYDQPQTPKPNQEPQVISNETPETPVTTDEQPKNESEQTPVQSAKNQSLKSAGISAAAGAVGGAVAGLGVQYADDLANKAGDAINAVEGWLGLNDNKEEELPAPGSEPAADPNAPAEPQNTHTENEPAQPATTQNVAHNPAPQPQEPEQPQQPAAEQPTNQTEQGTQLDTNHDGVTDAIALDQNHDGVVDAVAIDQNQDGTIDAVIIDQNQDGYAESQLVDVNHDGVVDAALVDSDGDHDLDTAIVDTNHDGQFTDADTTQALPEDHTIELYAHDANQPAGEAIADNQHDYDNNGPVDEWT
jgi:hypothetical protein